MMQTPKIPPEASTPSGLILPVAAGCIAVAFLLLQAWKFRSSFRVQPGPLRDGVEGSGEITDMMWI